MDWSSNGSTPQYQQNGAVGQQYHQPPPLQQHPLAAQAAAAPVRESIHTIHTVQRNDGVEDMYLVSLEDGGKRVRVSASLLARSQRIGCCRPARERAYCCSVSFFASSVRSRHSARSTARVHHSLQSSLVASTDIRATRPVAGTRLERADWAPEAGRVSRCTVTGGLQLSRSTLAA